MFFTYAFEELTPFLAQQCSRSFVAHCHAVIRGESEGLDGLRNIGVDELSFCRHHEQVTVVVDHDAGKVVWAAAGRNAETLTSFFEALGPERYTLLESVTFDLSAAYTKSNGLSCTFSGSLVNTVTRETHHSSPKSPVPPLIG